MQGCILALDSSTVCGSLALASGPDSVILAETSLNGANSSRLSVTVRQLLEQENLRSADLAAVIVGTGPGSFTGLRVGMAFARGLCVGLRIPLYMYSSLRACVACLPDTAELLVGLGDARRGELFYEIYRRLAGGRLELLEPAGIIAARELQQMIERHRAHYQLTMPEVVLASAAECGDSLIGGYRIERVQRLAAGLVDEFKAEHDGGKACKLFDLVDLTAAEPNYLRAVAAKTIAERQGDRRLKID